MKALKQIQGMTILFLLIFVFAGCKNKPPVKPIREPVPAVLVSSPVRFSDRAEQAGIHFRLGHKGKSPLTILETAGCGCAFLDYDSDGFLDILLVGEPRCALYRNRHDGTFEDVTDKVGLTATGTFLGCAVADYDNDGSPDILLTGFGRNVLYHNKQGHFEDVTLQYGLQSRHPYDWATSATFTDLDNDGRLDLVVCHYVTFTPKTLRTCAYEGIQAACPPFYYEPQTLTVFHNEGKRFRDVTVAWGFSGGHGNNLGVIAADFNEDGKPDLYVANDGTPADLWQNDGKSVGGAFTPHFTNIAVQSGTAYDADGAPQAGMGVDAGDYDGDGRLDLVVTTFQDQAKAVYHNEGEGQFRFNSFGVGVGAQTKTHLGFGVLLQDFDNDGWLDLMIANGHVQDTIQRYHPPVTYAQTPQCFWNKGDGTFAEVSSSCGPAFSTPIVGRGLASGDYDNDGKVDVLMVDIEGKPLLLHNESLSNHWLGIKLMGKKSNRDGIGARLTLEAGSRRIVQEVRTGRSYLSACDPRTIFGLGAWNRPVSLKVHWPAGQTERFDLPNLDRWLTLQEGSGKP